MMSGGTIALWLIAAALGALALSRRDGRHRAGLTFALDRFVEIFPRIILALLTAGFVSSLIPAETIAAWLGDESGLAGILLASLLGGIIPGGPVIAYPVAVLLDTAGAGLPQIVAFLTAWSVFAIHRVLLFEISLIGWRFTALRLASSLPLPVVAGLLAGLVVA
jgi:uncharacterized membrane protein YraQ (UPF0718 family)